MLLAAMTDPQSEPGFQVRDRRRRGEDDSPEVSPLTAPGGVVSPEPPAHETAPPPAERSLVGLFMMLGSFAVAAIEGAPDPVSGQARPDPAQAAELIDLLVLLREKTEGHRTAEETQALDDVIYELQVRYVQAVTRSG
jgi:hypothetical protein